MSDAWTPEGFWQYVSGLAGEFEAGQMRDTMAERGLMLAPAQEEPNPREAILESEVKRLTDRLETLAAGFGVPDGGKYIADWQTRIKKFQALSVTPSPVRMPDREAIARLPRRVERISGQRFSYVKLDDIFAILESSAALAPAAPAPGEPIAWRWRSLAGGDWHYRDGKDNPAGSFGPIEVEPLYAAPAPHAGEAEIIERCIQTALATGNFGDCKRDELTSDFGQPRFDMMNAIVEALHALAPIPDDAKGGGQRS